MEIYYISFSWLFSIDYSELDAVLRAQKIKTKTDSAVIADKPANRKSI